MNGEYLQGGGREMEVGEARILQMMKVALRERVPEVRESGDMLQT